MVEGRVRWTSVIVSRTPKRRHQPGDQAWATTLVMVDVAAQNPLSAAISTKSDENAYLSANGWRMRNLF